MEIHAAQNTIEIPVPGTDPFKLRHDGQGGGWVLENNKGANPISWQIERLFRKHGFDPDLLMEGIKEADNKASEYPEFFDYIHIVILKIYVSPVTEWDHDRALHALRGYIVCRMLLDWLNPARNSKLALRYEKTRLALLWLQYEILAYIFEYKKYVQEQFPGWLEGWELELEYRAALQDWYKVCLDPRMAWLFPKVIGRSREDAVMALLLLVSPSFTSETWKRTPMRFIKGSTPYDGYTLRRYFAEQESGQYFIEFLVDAWFLPRYALRVARSLQHTLQRVRNDSKQRSLRDECYIKRSLPGFALGSGVIFFMFTSTWVLSFWPGTAGWIGWLISGVAISFLAVTGVRSLVDWKYFDLQLPRLIAGIVVGYLPIVFEENAWRWAAQLSQSVSLLMMLVGGIVALCVLYTGAEINRVLRSNVGTRSRGVDWKIARRTLARTWPVFIRGLSYAFLFGIVLSNVLGNHIYSDPSSCSVQGSSRIWQECVPALSGSRIYPGILFIFMWLSFFIGLFIQLIWEDKPLTDPLR